MSRAPITRRQFIADSALMGAGLALGVGCAETEHQIGRGDAMFRVPSQCYVTEFLNLAAGATDTQEQAFDDPGYLYALSVANSRGFGVGQPNVELQVEFMGGDTIYTAPALNSAFAQVARNGLTYLKRPIPVELNQTLLVTATSLETILGVGYLHPVFWFVPDLGAHNPNMLALSQILVLNFYDLAVEQQQTASYTFSKPGKLVSWHTDYVTTLGKVQSYDAEIAVDLLGKGQLVPTASLSTSMVGQSRQLWFPQEVKVDPGDVLQATLRNYDAEGAAYTRVSLCIQYVLRGDS